MKDMIAICGLDCETCDARIATLTDDAALREKTAQTWSELNGVPITSEFGKFNIPGCITMSCNATKYRKIKEFEHSEYPGISRKNTSCYLKIPALLAWILALAAGERSAFT